VVVIEAGIYTELEAKMEPVLDNGYSIYIEAQYTDIQGITHPLVYYTDNDIDFEVENEEGIQVNDQEIKDLVVRIDLNGLFSNIDLSNAEMGVSGAILINEDNNEELADRIEEYLEEHAEFEEDDDNDNDEEDKDDEDDEGEDE
jgi:cobalamin biosynthesis protein CobT